MGEELAGISSFFLGLPAAQPHTDSELQITWQSQDLVKRGIR